MIVYSLDPTDNKYLPHDRTWVKEKILQHLKGQASK